MHYIACFDNIPDAHTVLKASRHKALLDRLYSQGSLAAAAEAARLGVSEDTVRRDLRELATAGALQRVHGGAVPRAPRPAAYVQRREVNARSKNAIARRAASLACDGQTLCLDGGTTTLRVAESLPSRLQATVITHAPAVATALMTHEGVAVHLAGGTLDKQLGVTLGSETTDFLRSFIADISFIGVCAIDASLGLTIPDPAELAVKRAIIAHSRRVVALADGAKLEQAHPCVVAPISAVTDLVTDEGAPAKTVAEYRRLGIRIHS